MVSGDFGAKVTTTAGPVKVIRHGQFFLDVRSSTNHLGSMSKKQTMTAPEVANLCGVDQKSIWNWMRKGLAPRHRKTPGGMAQFPVEAVARWMADNDFRVPPELAQYLTEPARTKELLFAAVDGMEHADRVALFAEYERWLTVRRA